MVYANDCTTKGVYYQVPKLTATRFKVLINISIHISVKNLLAANINRQVTGF